jgi:uncharacterized Ntn-hydrolase superfamily protein
MGRSRRRADMYGRGEHGTFSIAACDDSRQFWGAAVSTKPASVGATVPWAGWRVGALATQAMSNYYYGPDGLALLRRGVSAEDAVRLLTRADRGRDHRQLGVVDARGRSAAWTGSRCLEHALHQVGEGYTCQGNLLASADVVPAMARAFEGARGSLARRMLRALEAGAQKGGDRRGMESAALVVVHRERWFDRTWSDRWVDLRVDRHPHPIAELGRPVRADEAETRSFLRARAARLRRRRARRV